MTDYADLEKRLRASIYDSLDVIDEADLKAQCADALAALTKQLEEARELNRATLEAIGPFAGLHDVMKDQSLAVVPRQFKLDELAILADLRGRLLSRAPAERKDES